ncbi:DUF3106 domain-containing protein [Azoarcus indigens]|uniref:Uncharacterized protein DUF3106 n=1 Tax=Azoarcus indigens TaxID=29545 RepID=A0A4R6DSN0_9RHOO|nr:DUF3106 domain-containing protein [Azoarcus indigens]NMG66302.1 DUF3106 domain-containing protein [Azoarcus indigens]TDN47559.1 uncharacterized protein DUF3106 [Azoarcus indigens]
MAAPRYAVLILALVAAQAVSAAPVLAPSWRELGQHQKEILSPLADEWGELSAASRRKWVGIADRYDKLSTDEQARMQARMRDWARLQPAERQKAREGYLRLRDIPAEVRGNLNAEWERFQSLPPESRRDVVNAAQMRRPGAAISENDKQSNQ